MSEQNDTPPVREIELEELSGGGGHAKTLLGNNLDLIRHVKVRLAVSLGRSELTVGELMDLQEESIVKLDKESGEPVEILLGDKIVARGSLVVVDDHFGVRISEIAHS